MGGPERTALDLSVDDFLAGLSSEVRPEHGLVCVSYPNERTGGITTETWQAGRRPPSECLYYRPSTIIPRNLRDHKHRARATDFGWTFCITLDDVNTKIDARIIKLSPTYIIETSPGNYQWGYKLVEPVPIAQANAVVKAMVTQGLTDKGRSNLAGQMMRVPGSLNKKCAPFHARVHKWAL